jgi:hypothetical protein
VAQSLGVARAGWLQVPYTVLQASLGTETVCVIAWGPHLMNQCAPKVKLLLQGVPACPICCCEV